MTIDCPPSPEFQTGRIAVILTGYKRNHFPQQLQAIRSWNLPVEVYLWQNGSHQDLEHLRAQGVRLVHSKDVNFRFHGRFTLPLLLNEEYTLVLDDDCIPGPAWLSAALRLCDEKEAIVGGLGANYVDTKTYYRKVFNPPADTEVDLVGHAWLFKTEWAKYIWYDRPIRWDNGEDIHFSAACQLYGGIPTWLVGFQTPQHNGNSSIGLGNDNVATYKVDKAHIQHRMDVMHGWIDRGWEPLVKRGHS